MKLKKKHRNINQSKVVQIHLLGIELLRIGFGNLSVWKKERKTQKKRQNTNNNNLIFLVFLFNLRLIVTIFFCKKKMKMNFKNIKHKKCKFNEKY